MNATVHLLSEWFLNLSLYQYIGEVFAIALYLLSFISEKLIPIPAKINLSLLKDFLRRSSFLLAFSFIAIPWIISGIF